MSISDIRKRQIPILFNSDMVRAILDGRKTQTRRPVKHRENRWEVDEREDGVLWPYWPCYVYAEPNPIEMPSPFGEPGDVLWVRETWRLEHGGGSSSAGVGQWDYLVFYKADGSHRKFSHEGHYKDDPYGKLFDRVGEVNRPSIHMPKWASRIKLEVLRVWVERVQDISEQDAQREGISRVHYEHPPSPSNDYAGGYSMAWKDYGNPGEFAGYGGDAGCFWGPVDSFRSLWDSIYTGEHSWESNPWVWCCEFKRLEGK